MKLAGKTAFITVGNSGLGLDTGFVSVCMFAGDLTQRYTTTRSGHIGTT
jgi:hypothetical protein